jgi:hypothetical protein
MVFQPIGERSRRNVVIDRLGSEEPGSVVGYDELQDLLGVPDRVTVQAVVNLAKRGLLRECNKALEAVRGVGYRVILPNEHLGQAVIHQRKARRQVGKSYAVATFVDLAALTEGEAAALTLAATSLATQLTYMKRNDLRSQRLEDAVTRLETDQGRSDDELADLRDRLERLEARASQEA